jgi:hypothetical protein
LAEVLAALMFMAIVIPVAVNGLLVANRAGVTAQRSSVAVQLADGLLSEMARTGNWRDFGTAGRFGSDWEGYHWILRIEPWERDSMRLLVLEVFYPVQNQERSVRLSTLVEDI